MFLTTCISHEVSWDATKRPVSARSVTHVLTHYLDSHFHHNPVLFSSGQVNPAEAQAPRIHSACPRTARDGQTGPCLQRSTLRALRYPTSSPTPKPTSAYAPQRPFLLADCRPSAIRSADGQSRLH